MTLFRTGYSTGTCAAAAAKAAVLLLARGEKSAQVEVILPDATRVSLTVVRAVRPDETSAEAAVRKYAGDDPDVTDGAEVVARVAWSPIAGVTFRAGEGVGVITKPGLQLPPGEPAINPVPRQMIRSAIAEVTDRGVEVTIAIPGGAQLAARTYNPRLGIEGGLSVLGTSGLVRPFSTPALRDALKCTVAVVRANAGTSVVLVPGRIGERAARVAFRLDPSQVVEAGNEWGFVLDELSAAGFVRLLMVGHPGKLGKLVAGEWDTHSSRSNSALPVVHSLHARLCGVPTGVPTPLLSGAGVLASAAAATASPIASPTVEGFFEALGAPERKLVADALAAQVADVVATRFAGDSAVVLVNMSGGVLGTFGDLSPWQ